MKGVISKSLNDIFSPMIIGFVLKVGFGSILLWIILLSLFSDIYAGFIDALIAKIPFIGDWAWVQSSGVVIISFLLGYMLVIITISILTSIYSEPILIKLAKKHYPNIAVVGTPTIAKSLALTIKASIIFLGLFLISIPLLFIPIIGQLWMLWLWSILIKEPTAYDVGALFIDNRDTLNEKQKNSRVISILASLFNYIPLLNIFAPIFAQILFLHSLLNRR